MNYYPFHIGDYLSATRHLSWEEDAAYRRMLDTYYTTEKPLPLDERAVCRLVLATTESQREAVAVVLQEFFVKTDAGWINRRADGEILSMQEKQEKQRDKANKRWQKHAEELGTASAMPQHGKSDAAAQKGDAVAMPPTPTPTPNTSPVGDGGRKRPSPTAARPDDVSEPVWQDFQRLRREKRSPLTDTALAGVKREALKAGVTLEAALAYCCEAGWQGFNAGWYADRQGSKPAAGRAPAVRSFADQDREAGMARWEQMTGRTHPDRAQRQGNFIDLPDAGPLRLETQS